MEFDVILGMDWLFLCDAIFNYRTKIVILQLLDEPLLVCVWRGEPNCAKWKIISYLKAHKMISKRYIYHLVWVRDSKVEVPSLMFISIANKYPKVLSKDISRVLLIRNRIWNYYVTHWHYGDLSTICEDEKCLCSIIKSKLHMEIFSTSGNIFFMCFVDHFRSLGFLLSSDILRSRLIEHRPTSLQPTM